LVLPVVALLWVLYRLLGNRMLLAVTAGLVGAVGVYLGARRAQRRSAFGRDAPSAEAGSRPEDAR
jgi:hypothetical protein